MFSKFDINDVIAAMESREFDASEMDMEALGIDRDEEVFGPATGDFGHARPISLIYPERMGSGDRFGPADLSDWYDE